MIARLLTLLGLAVVLAILAAVAVASRSGWPTAAIVAVALAPLATVMGVYAIEGAWLLRRAADDPTTPRPAVLRVVAALCEELVRAAPLFAWHQPLSGRRPIQHLEEGCHAGRCGLVLVHGHCCNAGFWRGWSRRLTHVDRPHVAVTLEPAFGSIDDMTKGLDDGIRRLWATTRSPVVVVAHSMGGLVVRAWWRQHADWADTHVARVITIGTPHLGTTLAKWGHTLNTRQMRPHSPWLQALAACEPAERLRRFTCVHSDCDNVVFPPHRARLPGARAVLVPGAAHIAMLWRRNVVDLVDRTIDEVDRARAADAGPA